MPTFRERESSESMTHSNQTWYFILAQPPEVGNITYQITPQAAEFLVETLEYSDGQPIPWSLVSPLRRIQDLFTKEEGGPTNADPKSGVVRSFQTTTIDTATKNALLNYLESHPDVKGDLEAAATDLDHDDPSFIDHLSRPNVTRQWEKHGGNPKNNSLGKIAQKYFGDGRTTDRNDNTTGTDNSGDGAEPDTLTVTDRNGTEHEFPRLDERNETAEAYRIFEQVYRRWGPTVGESIINSARYEEDEAGFPNRWIGQTEDDAEPSIEDAVSPLAYYYREYGSHGEGELAREYKDAFDEECEFDLETYRANFPNPTSVDPFDSPLETVDKSVKPWEDFHLPVNWATRFDGIPPLIQGVENSHLEAADKAVLETMSSLENAPGVIPSLLGELDDETIGTGIRRFLTANFDLRSMNISGDATLEATVYDEGQRAEITWFYDGDCTILLESNRLSGAHEVTVKSWHIIEWVPPEAEGVHDTQSGLFEQSQYFSVARELVDAIGRID